MSLACKSEFSISNNTLTSLRERAALINVLAAESRVQRRGSPIGADSSAASSQIDTASIWRDLIQEEWFSSGGGLLPLQLRCTQFYAVDLPCKLFLTLAVRSTPIARENSLCTVHACKAYGNKVRDIVRKTD